MNTSLYIHIPFCSQACHYCSFYFVLTTTQKATFIEAIKKELQTRALEYKASEIKTIYIGGGTPTLLSIKELESLLDIVYKYYTVANDVEINIESNPENLTLEYLKGLNSIRIDRLSIGVQSFEEYDLTTMNRSHTTSQAHQAIKEALTIFDSVSIDFIFGLPYANMNIWKKNLKIATEYKVNHISTYNLTVEEKTALHRKVQNKQIKVVEDKLLNDMYLYTIEYLDSKGFEQYEISNFSKLGHASKHNQAYWNQTPYIGVGPSAHSYNGHIRRNNVANLNQYIKSIENNSNFWEEELLTLENKYNEYVLTKLRTSEGLKISNINTFFGSNFAEYFKQQAANFISKKTLLEDKEDNRYYLSNQGKLLADSISMTLMMV